MSITKAAVEAIKADKDFKIQDYLPTMTYTELIDWHVHNRDIAYRDGTSPELTNASQRAEAFLKAINAWKQ